MGWATLTLRKVTLKQELNDNNLEQLQLSSEQRRLSNFSTAVGQGMITPDAITSLGTGLFGEALDYMTAADAAAREVAQEQTDYYCQTYESITADQYANSGLATQATLYFDENGSLDQESIFQNFYEENLKEYAEEYVQPLLNEIQKELETKMTKLETEAESMQAELDQLSDQISSEIQDNTIKLA